jgi:hypothetical protein
MIVYKRWFFYTQINVMSNNISSNSSFMNTFKTGCYKRFVLITSMLLAAPFLKANVVLSTDDFQQVDYGTVLTSIGGLSGGRGWEGGWDILQGNVEFRPNRNLAFNNIGYFNTGSGSGNAGGGAFETEFDGISIASRQFAPIPISEGEIWVSYLINRGSVAGNDKRTGITFSRDGTFNRSDVHFFIGTRSNQFGIGSSQGFLNLAQVSGNTNQETHLIVGRIDLANNTLSAWFNPPNVSSLSALGAPHVTDSSQVIGQINGTFRIFMQETSNLRITIDGLRIARGNNPEALLRTVATGL